MRLASSNNAFVSSLAFAATLSVTWLDGRIPSHNSSSCQNSAGEYTLNKDTTEDPYDVVFSTDGLQVFSVNNKQASAHSGYGNMNMNRLSRPFDMTSVRRDNRDFSCDSIDAFRVNESIGFLLLRPEVFHSYFLFDYLTNGKLVLLN